MKQTLFSSMLSWGGGRGLPEWPLFTCFLSIIVYLSGTGRDTELTVRKRQRLLLLWWVCTPQEEPTAGLYGANELERVLPPGDRRAPACSGDLGWFAVPLPVQKLTTQATIPVALGAEETKGKEIQAVERVACDRN